MLGYKLVCHDDQSSSDNLDGVYERIIRIIDSGNGNMPSEMHYANINGNERTGGK